MARTGRPYIKDEMAKPKPHQRRDGQLYDRPEPNPFTMSWNMGYEDGFEGFLYKPEDNWTKLDIERYRDGYEAGEEERRQLDRVGSSNT